MAVEYREEPCRVHRCTFCYVRAFERRADRPSDDRYPLEPPPDPEQLSLAV